MSKERIAMLVRTAVLFVALLNQLLLVFGYSILPVSEQEFEALFSALLGSFADPSVLRTIDCRSASHWTASSSVRQPAR